MIDFFEQINIPHFNYSNFVQRDPNPTTISIAISGGGYRSMLTGSGILAAYDIRTPCSNNSGCGKLGNVLQSSTYIAGISGGSWLVMSNLINDFRPTYELWYDDKTWTLQQQLLEGVPNFDPNDIRGKVQEKINDSNDVNSTSIEKDHLPNSNVKKIISNLESSWGIAESFLKNFGTSRSSSNKMENGDESETGSRKDDDFMLKNIIKPLFMKKNETAESTKPEFTLRDSFRFFKELQIEVRPKKEAGFYISFTDYWGRALARKIFHTGARAPGATMTSSIELSSFKNFLQPFPIICSVEKTNPKLSDNQNSHTFEFTPYEFGSWDSYLKAFVPIKYLGSSLYNGFSSKPTENPNISICTSGYDNVGFITGTSSSLFNQMFLYIYQMLSKVNFEVSFGIQDVLKIFGLDPNSKPDKESHYQPDYAVFSPNPFYGYEKSNPYGKFLSKSKSLYLADGGDGGENIPFHPLLISARKVDIIFAFDMSSDMNNFPNGSVLTSSTLRYHNASTTDSYFQFQDHCLKISPNFEGLNFNNTNNTMVRKFKSVFPKIPTPEVIVKHGWDKKPVFFGCNLDKDYPDLNTATILDRNNKASSIENFSQRTEETHFPPLIVYTANHNHTFDSNRSTFQLSYKTSEVQGMVQNGYNLATYMNSTEYARCIGCAILKRKFDRAKYIDLSFKVPSVCEECYEEYCYSDDQGCSSVSGNSGLVTF